MEEIFNNFRNDYNLAMENYGKGEYIYYFRNIRPALEWLSKLIIADQLYGICKPSDIFSGQKVIRRHGGEYSIQSGSKRELKGRQLIENILTSFLLKRKDVREARYDEELKSLREGMEMYSNCIRRFYSVASAGNHSSQQKKDDKSTAIKFASILSDFITFLIDNEILNSSNTTNLKKLNLIRVIDEKDLESINSEKKLIRDQYLKQKQELEEALKKIEEYRQEQQITIQNSNDALSEKEKRIQELETEIEKLKLASTIEIESRPLITPISQPTTDLALSDEKIDEDQEDIILAADEESLLVCGCAGSGKSVIAMKKAKQFHESGRDVITIAYTKSLNSYMRAGAKSDIGKFYYHFQWKKEGCPNADYIIVDEIQDFTADEIREFIMAAKKHFFFFGDSAQSIFDKFKNGVVSIDKISELTQLTPMMLYTNYRLPRPIAKLTQEYVGINVEPYSERTYKNDITLLPSIVEYKDNESQVAAIAKIIENNTDKSIGIFLPDNSKVLEFCKLLSVFEIPFEFKYELQKAYKKRSGYKPYNTLNFSNILPKIMTYHSAKGLQFEIVILPWFEGANSVEDRKALYVAMTRSQSQLIITFKDQLSSPLKNIPEILYKKTI